MGLEFTIVKMSINRKSPYLEKLTVMAAQSRSKKQLYEGLCNRINRHNSLTPLIMTWYRRYR